MGPRPLRLPPGADLRRVLEQLVADSRLATGFVIAGIGSLGDAVLRFAGEAQATTLAGPHEIISLSGSLSRDGAHLHMAVAGPDGRLSGGHVGYGNTVRTTAELLLAETPGWEMTRAFDAATGFSELHVQDARGDSGTILLGLDDLRVFEQFRGDRDGWCRWAAGRLDPAGEERWRAVDEWVSALRSAASGHASAAFIGALQARLAAVSSDPGFAVELQRIAQASARW